MANVNVNVDQLLPAAGSDSSGRRFAFISGATKATASDTITLVGANSVLYASIKDDSTGVEDDVTVATNVLTLAGAATGTVSGIVVYK